MTVKLYCRSGQGNGYYGTSDSKGKDKATCKESGSEFKVRSATDEDAEPANYEVVRVKSCEMKPISVQEAIMNMNLLGHTFYTFLNRETDNYSLQKKRRRLRLVEP